MRIRRERRTLADGTVKVYEYARKPPKRKRRAEPRSLGALILEYRRTPEYAALKPATKKTYERAMGHMHKLYPSPVEDLKRRHVVGLRNAFAHRPALADQIRAVFSVLMRFAIDMEYRDTNPAAGIKPIASGEHARWTDEQVAHAVAELPEPQRRAVVLALYTGQRAGDLIRMTWADYDGEGIQVAQEKTGAKLWIPCHRALRAELDRWKERRTATTILTGAKGRPYAASGSFSTLFTEERAKHPILAGVVFHGLRKTAAARLAEAGCSTLEIAAITGHTTLKMIELYTRQADQRTRAKAAVVRLETNAAKRP